MSLSLIFFRSRLKTTLNVFPTSIESVNTSFLRKKTSFHASQQRLSSTKIRNIGILAHIDAGKTTTTEHILYLTGKTAHIGRVDNGDTVMDYLPQEKERGITISAAAISCNWKDHQINIIDTPGHIDFSMEVEVATKVIDGCVLILDAVAGVQCQTKTVWKKISGRNIPAVAFINKMDRDGADFQYAMSTIPQQLHIPTLALQYPLYETNVSGASKPKFLGFIDLLSEQSFLWDGKQLERSPSQPPSSSSSSTSNTPSDYPDPSIQSIEEATTPEIYEILTQKRQELLETIADHDEEFMSYYLDYPTSATTSENKKELSRRVFLALQRIVKQRKIIPVLCGSAIKGLGVHSLLDSILCFLPSPAEIPPKTLISISDPSNHPPRSFPSSTEESTSPSPLLGQVFKVLADPNRGVMSFVRLFSGRLHSKQMVYNPNKQKEERIFQLLEIASNQFDPIESLSSGEIGCIIGCKYTRIGDTLVDSKDRKTWGQYRLEGMMIPKPVFSQAIETKYQKDTKELERVLGILLMEDPSLVVEQDAETGETILYGLGELHLEILCDKITRQYQVPILKGKASIHYRESIQSYLEEEEFVWVYDRIIDEKRLYAKITFAFTSLLNENPSASSHPSSHLNNSSSNSSSNSNGSQLLSSATQKFTEENLGKFSIAPEMKAKLTTEEYNVIVDTLQSCMARGPHGYPIIDLEVQLKDIEKVTGITTPGAIRACIATGFHHFLKEEHHHQYLEPMMKVEIDIPQECMGEVISDLTAKRRAQEIEMQPIPESSHLIIQAIVPLQGLLGYITELRSMTRGEGIFSSEYLHHAPVEKVFVK